MPNTDRWNFTPATAKIICEKAAARCANPNCRRLARLPNRIGDEIISFGEAAHILPARPNGPRKLEGVTFTEREIKSEANGLWLCASCHRMVDRDDGFYTVEKLRAWKALSEKQCDYDPPTVALSLPGFYDADTVNQAPGLTGSTAHFGAHVLVGPAVGLRAVCTKITIEVVSETGTGELRSEHFYNDPEPGVAAVTTDWHSFMLTGGQSSKIYFGNNKIGWVNHSPGGRMFGVVLLRAKVYSRLGADDLEPFASPWLVAIFNGTRLEIDQTNDYAHLVGWADTLASLMRSDNPQFRALGSAIFSCQKFHITWAMFVVESLGNERIETKPELVKMDPADLLRAVPKSTLNGDNHRSALLSQWLLD